MLREFSEAHADAWSEPEDQRSAIEQVVDRLSSAVVKPLRTLLRFEGPYARRHYQAHDADPIEVLLLKLTLARADPFVPSVDRKRLRRFSLRRYFLRQPVPPFKRPGPRATLMRREWRAVGGARDDLKELFRASGAIKIAATEIAAVLSRHLAEHQARWVQRAALPYNDDPSRSAHVRVRDGLQHFLELSRSMIDRSIAQARRR